MTALLIAANTVIFLYQVSLPPRAAQAIVYSFGMVPARVDQALAGQAVSLTHAFAPFLTSMFLHGGWLHLIGNMLFLWVFGTSVEDHLGHLEYLVFYVVCGVGSAVVHTLANWGSSVPAIGASGAISGVMGAYIVLFPRSRVLTLIPLLFFFFTVHLPAVLMLGYWFVIQFLAGISTLGRSDAGGVAWWAHIGGFLIGALLVVGSRRR